jgi:putative ABC transport system permease protein
MMRRRSLFEFSYRTALLLFPRAFRERYADEMCELAGARFALMRPESLTARLRVAFALIAELAPAALSQWATGRAVRARTLPIPAQYPRDNMDILIQDVRFALRSLARRPTFTIIAALTLALGIGANTAIFSVVNAVLLRPLPYPEPDRMALVWGTQGSQGNNGVVYPDYLDWKARNRTFADMGAVRGQSVNMTGGDTPERLVGSFVSASLFRVVGAKMADGRAFTDAETELATKAPVAVLSYDAWTTHFGSAPMLGKTIVINGTTFTIVGILAKNSEMPLGVPDVMVPIGYYPNAKGLDRGVRGIVVAARLKPNVTIAAAQRDLSAIATQLEQEFPTTNKGTGAEVVSLKEYMVQNVRASLLIILGAVGIVLLIACANVANLQLARGAARARELSVRAALGAGRSRIAQQLLTESIVLSLVGGIAGVALAFGLMKALVAMIGSQLPVDPAAIRLDAPVLGFALAIAIATGLIFGIVPALKASRADLNEMLRTRSGGGGEHAATRNTLVVVQLALSLALLASAGLITRSLVALQRVNPGFNSEHLLTAQFRLSAVKYDSPDKIWAMFERAVIELRAIPGVQSAALVRTSPFSQGTEDYPITIDGKPAQNPADAPQMEINSITTGYFSTMQTPVLIGRDIVETDRAGAPLVMLVNRSFANTTWPNESPIGKRLKFGDGDWRTIVGVVADTKSMVLNAPQPMQGFVPHAQRPQIFTSIVVRTKGNPLDYSKAVREAIWRVDRDQPIWRFRSMEQDLDAGVTSTKTMMVLTAMFAIVALLVAAIGIYGVLSYTMSRRTKEVGIRIALGAEASTVTRMVVREGARLIAIAVVIGLIASFVAARLLRSQLFGVEPNDVPTLAAVTVILSVVAIAACYIPARRASRVDPMVALRAE